MILIPESNKVLRRGVTSLSCFVALLCGLSGCGGGENDVKSSSTSPFNQVSKMIVDADLVYPFGLTVYEDTSGVENIVLGNTYGRVISSPGGINGAWLCTRGLLNHEIGEVYNYRFGEVLEKRYIKSYKGFIERGTYYKNTDGVIDFYFVENRDGYIVKIDSSLNDDSLISTNQARPYDIKVADLSGNGPDIVYSTYLNNQLILRQASSGNLMVLADQIIENRTVELFKFDGDRYPSIITTGVGASKDINPLTGWVSVIRNHGSYRFSEHRFDVRGAGYARIVYLDARQPNQPYLIVSHGVRDDIQASNEHGLSIFKYFSIDNTIEKVAEIKIPYAYRFDFKDLNQDGIKDVVLGGHDGSGRLIVLLSRDGLIPIFDLIQIDQGLVAINDLKFGRDQLGIATLYVVADNGNFCPRKIGGSRLIRYQFTMPVSATSLNVPVL